MRGKVIIALLLLLSTFSVLLTSQLVLDGTENGGAQEANSYKYHIAMVTQNGDSLLWQDVFRMALEEGKQQDALVERIGDTLAEQISAEQAMEMAIYAQVDGILVQGEDSESMIMLIGEAKRRGIPVITMLRDVANSDRQAFVGLNDYFLGQEYGKRVRLIAGEGERRVLTIFSDANSDESGRRWFMSGLQNVLSEERFQIRMQIAENTNGLHNADVIVQRAVEQEKEIPDVLICLEPVVASSAVQILREEGLSGSVRIIGEDTSEALLASIAGGEVDSTITVDPEMLGRLSVDAMVSYLRSHMVSYFTSVDTRLITRESLGEEAAQ